MTLKVKAVEKKTKFDKDPANPKRNKAILTASGAAGPSGAQRAGWAG